MKSLKLKKLIAVALVGLTVAALSPIGASAEWKRDSNGWWNTEGSSYSVGWRLIGGEWYYFDSTGYMKTGWVNDRGTWYYLQSSGAMETGWVNDGGTWYYLQSSGAMKTGWVNDGGIWYYLQSSGAMKTGWINDNGTWYFASTLGAMQTGVVEVDGKVYYLQANGAMATGTVVIDGVAYTFATSGEAIGSKIPTPTKVFSGNGSVVTVPTPTPIPVDVDNGGSSHHSSGGSSGGSVSLSDLSDGGTHDRNYIISTTGTFGSSTATTTINGNISISNANALSGNTITLRNLDINGTLSINFGEGNVILDNVTVDGVNVSNIGANSLHVKGNSSIGTLEINDANNDAHIVVEGNAAIENTTILSGAELEVADGANANAFSNVTISPNSTTAEIKLKGTFNNVVVDKPSKNISLEKGSIGTISVNGGAAGAEIKFAAGTTVTNLNIKASIAVTGTGTITNANLGVSGITIETKPTNIAVAPGVTAIIHGEKVDENTPGVTIIDDTIGEFQKDINSKYIDYAKVTIVKANTQPSNGKVSFKVEFIKDADNKTGGDVDYVTQDILVTNADGTDEGIEYNDGEYTAPAGSIVYSTARVYRSGQIGYVTVSQTVNK